MQDIILRGEVLRQLVGAASSWAFTALLVFFWYRYLWFLSDRIRTESVYAHFSGLLNAFRPVDAQSDTALGAFTQPRSRDVLRRIFFVLGILFAGYYLGYNLHVGYISGEITLIATVSRVMNFYHLVHLIFQVFLSTAFVFALWVQTFTKDRDSRLLRFARRTLTVLAYGIAIVLPLAGIGALYVNLATQV